MTALMTGKPLEYNTLIQGAVRIDGRQTTEENHPRDEVAGKTISRGRRFVRLTRQEMEQS